MAIEWTFRNSEQRRFFYSKARNNVFNGGFGSGKTVAACMRAIAHLMSFDNYRMLFGRWTHKTLTQTTMQTFFNFCPIEFIARHSEQEAITDFINGSRIYWRHLDTASEEDLRGLEINSAFVDQAEEIPEGIYLVLDSRIGRWDRAVPSAALLRAVPNWPKNDFGVYKVPNYNDATCNPDVESHWLYRVAHPDSEVRNPTYAWFHAATDVNMNDPATLEQMSRRDPSWVKKYMKGEWGASEATIHSVNKMSYLDYDPEFFKTMISQGALYRTLDHGDAAPTCCLWGAAYKGVYIFYREYYVPGAVISEHRKAIHDLTLPQEHIIADWADPAIFKKNQQKEGGFWSTADEYLTEDIQGLPLYWAPADNNEFGTRNRINERLAVRDCFKHPITGVSPAPGIYFIRKSVDWPFGCRHVIDQTIAQRKVLLDTENGKSIYSDEREKSIADHAYDTLRYWIAMHATGKDIPKPRYQKDQLGHYIEKADKAAVVEQRNRFRLLKSRAAYRP